MRTYQKLMMLAAALLTAGTVAVNAQDFYYDDIYTVKVQRPRKNRQGYTDRSHAFIIHPKCG